MPGPRGDRRPQLAIDSSVSSETGSDLARAWVIRANMPAGSTRRRGPCRAAAFPHREPDLGPNVPSTRNLTEASRDGSLGGAEGMRIKEWYELADELRERYWASRRRDRGEILDAFCLATGYNRRYAMAVLRGRPSRPSSPGPRRRRGGPASRTRRARASTTTPSSAAGPAASEPGRWPRSLCGGCGTGGRIGRRACQLGGHRPPGRHPPRPRAPGGERGGRRGRRLAPALSRDPTPRSSRRP